MAIFTNMEAVKLQKHGIAETTGLAATENGFLYDLIVRDGENKEISVDNGVAVKVGTMTGDGLQTRYATIAGEGDKIAFVADVPVIKVAFTKAQADEWNFTNRAGKPVRAYEVLNKNTEMFGIADYQITSGTVTKGAKVVVDGNGGWKIEANPSASTYGFIGEVADIAKAMNSTIVRISVVQNVQL